MQARCWSRHCLQASACAARAVPVLPKPSSTSTSMMMLRVTTSSRYLQRDTCSEAANTWSASCARRLVQCLPQSFRKLQRVLVRPEMHEDQPWLLGQHMAVNRRHLDAVGAQRLDHWIHLFGNQDEIAGDGRLAAAGRLEVDRGGGPGGPGRNKLRAVLGNGIAPRHRELIDAAVGLALGADDLLDLAGVEVDRRRRSGSGRR